MADLNNPYHPPSTVGRTVIGPDMNSGSGRFWAGSGPVPVDLAGTRPVPQFFHGGS